jgi:hypothetical protein
MSDTCFEKNLLIGNTSDPASPCESPPLRSNAYEYNAPFPFNHLEAGEPRGNLGLWDFYLIFPEDRDPGEHFEDVPV